MASVPTIYNGCYYRRTDAIAAILPGDNPKNIWDGARDRNSRRDRSIAEPSMTKIRVPGVAKSVDGIHISKIPELAYYVIADPLAYFTDDDKYARLVKLAGDEVGVLEIRSKLIAEKEAQEADAVAICAQLPKLSSSEHSQSTALRTMRHKSTGEVLLALFDGLRWAGITDPNHTWSNWLHSALQKEIEQCENNTLQSATGQAEPRRAQNRPVIAYEKFKGVGGNLTVCLNASAFKICLRLLAKHGDLPDAVVDEAFDCMMRLKVGDETLVKEVIQNAQTAAPEAREFVMGSADCAAVSTALSSLDTEALSRIFDKQLSSGALTIDINKVAVMNDKVASALCLSIESRTNLEQEECRRRIDREDKDAEAKRRIEQQDADLRQAEGKQRLEQQKFLHNKEKEAFKTELVELKLKRAKTEAEMQEFRDKKRLKGPGSDITIESWSGVRQLPGNASHNPSFPKQWDVPIWGPIGGVVASERERDPYGISTVPMCQQTIDEMMLAGRGCDVSEDPTLVLAFEICKVPFVPSRAATMKIDSRRVPNPYIFPVVGEDLPSCSVFSKWTDQQKNAYVQGYVRCYCRSNLLRKDLDRYLVSHRVKAELSQVAKEQSRSNRVTWRELAAQKGLQPACVEVDTTRAAAHAFQTHWLHDSCFLKTFVRLSLDLQF